MNRRNEQGKCLKNQISFMSQKGLNADLFGSPLHWLSWIRIRIHVYGQVMYLDPDPFIEYTDPQHCRQCRHDSLPGSKIVYCLPFIWPCVQMTSHSSRISLDTCS